MSHFLVPPVPLEQFQIDDRETNYEIFREILEDDEFIWCTTFRDQVLFVKTEFQLRDLEIPISETARFFGKNKGTIATEDPRPTIPPHSRTGRASRKGHHTQVR